jgi:hypothetical protein
MTEYARQTALDELIEENQETASSDSGLPPGCVYKDGQLVRPVKRQSSDGTEWIQYRPVALDPVQARVEAKDYYHPQFGWVKEGYKLIKDRSLTSILADDSASRADKPLV